MFGLDGLDCKEFLRPQRIIRRKTSPPKVVSSQQQSGFSHEQPLTNPPADS